MAYNSASALLGFPFKNKGVNEGFQAFQESDVPGMINSIPDWMYGPTKNLDLKMFDQAQKAYNKLRYSEPFQTGNKKFDEFGNDFHQGVMDPGQFLDPLGFWDSNRNPFSDKYGQQGYDPYSFAKQGQSISPTDRYAGVDYTGPDKWTPPEANPEDYWDERASGYTAMPQYDEQYTPYTPDYEAWRNPTPLGQDALDFFGNANTHAPWTGYSPGGDAITPWEAMQQPDYNAAPGRRSTAWTGSSFANFLNPISSPGSLFGMRKGKKNSDSWNAPAYQGYMFTPREGFPEYYSPSNETTNQTQQDIYAGSPLTQSAGTGYSVPGMAGQSGAYDYNYTGGGNNPQTGQQNYVGQQDQQYGSLYGDPRQTSLYNTFKPGEFNG